MPPNENETTFPLLLRRHRERIGLSKTELARLMGVSTGYVYLLEKGKTPPPTLQRVQQLVEILELPPLDADALTVAAAAGRTGAAEAKVLRQTGPRQVAFPEGGRVAEVGAGFPDGIDLRDCVAVPVQTNAMAPILCDGQLAICSRARGLQEGDLVMATTHDGDVLVGQYYPAGNDVQFTTLQSSAERPRRVPRTDLSEVLPVIGILFDQGRV